MKDMEKRLDALRRKGESKKDFARRIGVSPVQLSRYYSGVVPGRRVLTRIAERTGASLDWFLRPDGEAMPVRRIGHKRGGPLSDSDLVNLACSYIDEMRGMGRAEREAVKELLREVCQNPESLGQVMRFLGFMKFERKSRHRKGPMREQ
jgi:transcriptional regulator with XRE-family HTH domain